MKHMCVCVPADSDSEAHDNTMNCPIVILQYLFCHSGTFHHVCDAAPCVSPDSDSEVDFKEVKTHSTLCFYVSAISSRLEIQV